MHTMRTTTLTLFTIALGISLLTLACDDDGPSGADDVAGDTAPSDTSTLDDTGVPDAAPDASEDDSSTTDLADTDSPGDTTSDTADTADVPLPECTRSGFVVAAQAAEGEDTFAAWYAATSTMTPTDRATFEVLDVPREPFEFQFTGENYKGCDVCLTFGASCDNMACEKTFLAVAGTAAVTTWGTVGESFAGTFTDIVAVEVTIADDFTSTPVAAGEVLCVDSLAFDATLDAL